MVKLMIRHPKKEKWQGEVRDKLAELNWQLLEFFPVEIIFYKPAADGTYELRLFDHGAIWMVKKFIAHHSFEVVSESGVN